MYCDCEFDTADKFLVNWEKPVYLADMC